MFQAEIHLQQHKACVVNEIAATLDTDVDIAIEELHDELVTFVLDLDEDRSGVLEILTESEQVKHVEALGDGSFLVTKTSCGAYSAIDRNHGVLRRRNFVGSNRRVYSVLFFRRQDLRAIIDDFRKIGNVTLEKVARFDESGVRLTDRQYEVVQAALEAGYFEWPRGVTSDELADELGISRATLLEHLRKAESKLIADGLETAKTGRDRTTPTEPASPPK